MVPGVIEAASATAKALTREISRKDGIAANLAYLKTNPGSALAVAQACAAMDDAATVFDLLDGYYFGEGVWSGLTPPAGDQDRQTSPLFQPPMRGLWKDERFAALVTAR